MTPERQGNPVAGAPESGRRPGHERPAATAAGRVWGASLLLGGLGLMSAVFVLVRLVESWRVGSGATSHRIEIFGQGLSYPAANVNAIVILLLAALGSVVTVRALGGAIREYSRLPAFCSRRLVSAARDPAWGGGGSRRAAARVLRGPVATTRICLGRRRGAPR